MTVFDHQEDVPLWAKVERALTVCPFCAKELEINPIASTKSCFVHGDFTVREDGDNVKLEMRLMRWGF